MPPSVIPSSPLGQHAEYYRRTIALTPAASSREQAGVVEHVVVRRPRPAEALRPAGAAMVALVAALYGAAAWSAPPWPVAYHAVIGVLALITLLMLLMHCSELQQSATPLPGLGLMLETRRRLKLGTRECVLLRARKLVPLQDVSTIVINEGLVRWGVRYYLAVVRKSGAVTVAYDSVHPAPAVLTEIYHCIREALFDEYADDTKPGH